MEMNRLGLFHFWIGVGGMCVFALTGQYMDRVLDHLVGMSDGPRMLYRSAHIYILLASMMNLIYGIIFGRFDQIGCKGFAPLLLLCHLL